MKTFYRVDAAGRVLQSVSTEADAAELGVAEAPSASLIEPRWDGKKWVESASNTTRSRAFAQHRLECVSALAAEAEVVRAHLFPVGPHALAVREQKLREARCVLYGSPKEEPLILTAEASAAGSDVKTLAAQLIEQHAAWCKTMGQIEAILRKHTDRLSREKERAGLVKVLEAGRAALWAVMYGATPATVEESPVEEARVEEAAAEMVAVAVKAPQR